MHLKTKCFIVLTLIAAASVMVAWWINDEEREDVELLYPLTYNAYRITSEVTLDGIEQDNYDIYSGLTVSFDNGESRYCTLFLRIGISSATATFTYDYYSESGSVVPRETELDDSGYVYVDDKYGNTIRFQPNKSGNIDISVSGESLIEIHGERFRLEFAIEGQLHPELKYANVAKSGALKPLDMEFDMEGHESGDEKTGIIKIQTVGSNTEYSSRGKLVNEDTYCLLIFDADDSSIPSCLRNITFVNNTERINIGGNYSSLSENTLTSVSWEFHSENDSCQLFGSVTREILNENNMTIDADVITFYYEGASS